VPVSVVDVLGVIDSRSARARVRSRPHQEADPFQVPLLAELPQRHVGLLLQLRPELGPQSSAIQVRPERGLRAQLAEGASKRETSKRISAVLEKSGDDGPVAGEEDVQQWNGRDLGAVCEGQLDEGQPVML
jgi:hypothetical protein